MKKLASRLKRFLKSEDGPTAVEYAVMLALIVVVVNMAIHARTTRQLPIATPLRVLEDEQQLHPQPEPGPRHPWDE